MHPEPYKGSSTYDKSHHTYTPFSTESDAMLASLLLAHEIPRSTMDFILSVINKKSFDTSEVTLKSSTDIYAISEMTRISNLQAIAVNRELAAHEPPFRTRPRDCTSSTVNLPSHVMENVMEFIHAERDVSLDYVRHRQCSKVHDLLPSELGADLLNMSLVHRTWTFSAQQTLGRIACIEVPCSPSALDSFLRSPCFGPWTREIILTVGMTESKYGDGSHALDFLQRFLLRFQNLRSFTLKVGPYGRHWVRDHGAEILRRNTYLRKVSIQTFNGADFHLSPVLGVLNGLRYLDSVEIGDCMSHGLALEQHDAQPASSSPRSVSMALLNHKDEERLQALASSKRDNKLLSLSLQFGHGLFSHFSFDPRRIDHIFRDLQELRFPPRDTESLAETLIPLCPSLRKLRLDLQPASESDYLEELQRFFPSSLEHLGFHFVNTQLNEGKDMADWDAQISELLSRKRLAALRSVEVEAPRFYETSKLIHFLRRKDKSRQFFEGCLRERSCSLFSRTRQASTENKIQLCLELCSYES